MCLALRTRWFLWKLSIICMLTLLIGVLPLYQIRLVVVGKNRGGGCGPFLTSVDWRRRNALIVTLSCWTAYIWAFWKVGDPFPILSKEHGI